MRLELLEEPPLLVREARRHEDVHEHAVVTGAAALQHRHAAPAQDDDLPGLGARLDVDLRLSVDRRDRDPRTEGGLRDRQVQRREDVVPLADEARIRLHADEDVDVARGDAGRARVPFAPDPDALAVVDAGRDVDLEAPLLDRPALATARGARLLDPSTGAAACGAG